MDRTGIRRSVTLYFILAFIVLVSLHFFEYSAAVIAYSLIILISYSLIKRHVDFRWGNSMWSGLLFGLILISAIFIIEWGLGWFEFKELNSDVVSILIGAAIFEVLVSVGEELSFRGYILPNLMHSIGMGKAIIVSSLLFAGLHIPSIMGLEIGAFNSAVMFASVTTAGAIMAILYLMDGLKMSIGFHFSWNFFQYHIFSLRTGFGIFDAYAAKSVFTGGEAGPEAGIIGLLVLLVGILISLLMWCRFSVKNKYLNAIVEGVHHD